MAIVTVKAQRCPTEDPEKIRAAILNVFPGADITVEESMVLGKSRNIEEMADMLERQMIRDTARSVLLNSVNEDLITFHISKQAAFAGKVNFTDGDSVLGDLEITIETQEPEIIINQLTGVEG